LRRKGIGVAFVDLRDPDDAIIKIISINRNIKCNLVALNYKGKDRVKFFIHEALKEYKAEEYVDDIFLSVMELSFNAVKANYAYVTVLDKVRRMLQYKAAQIDLDSIWKSQYMMNMYKNFIDHVSTKDIVKDIIRGEGSVFKIRALAEKEERELTPEEEADIEQKLSMMDRAINDKVKATLSISRLKDRVIIDVINDAPITEFGLERIITKRRLFREYYEEDKIGEFYMENLDDSESAGFGAAMIDSRLLAWNLEPWEHFKVLSLNKKTCANLTVIFK